jgi:hypothetical protein
VNPAHVAQIRTWVRNGMTVPQVAQIYRTAVDAIRKGAAVVPVSCFRDYVVVTKDGPASAQQQLRRMEQCLAQREPF